MKRKVRTHTFNGVKYHLMIGEFDGLTDTRGKRKDWWLAVNCDLNTQKGIVSVIHETLHASFGEMREDTVDRASKDIGRLLWRLGYRKT